MTNMKPPQGKRNTGAPWLRGLQGRSATGLNGQAAKDEVSAVWRGLDAGNISGVPAGRSVFHLTSPLIGLLDRVVESASAGITSLAPDSRAIQSPGFVQAAKPKCMGLWQSPLLNLRLLRRRGFHSYVLRVVIGNSVNQQREGIDASS